MCLELERRRYEIAYVRTKNDCKVDFLAKGPGLPALLMQVFLDISDAATRDRELRALEAAAKEHPRATPVLLTLESIPPAVEMPGRVKWVTAADRASDRARPSSLHDQLLTLLSCCLLPRYRWRWYHGTGTEQNPTDEAANDLLQRMVFPVDHLESAKRYRCR